MQCNKLTSNLLIKYLFSMPKGNIYKSKCRFLFKITWPFRGSC